MPDLLASLQSLHTSLTSLEVHLKGIHTNNTVEEQSSELRWLYIHLVDNMANIGGELLYSFYKRDENTPTVREFSKEIYLF